MRGNHQIVLPCYRSFQQGLDIELYRHSKALQLRSILHAPRGRIDHHQISNHNPTYLKLLKHPTRKPSVPTSDVEHAYPTSARPEHPTPLRRHTCVHDRTGERLLEHTQSLNSPELRLSLLIPLAK